MPTKERVASRNGQKAPGIILLTRLAVSAVLHFCTGCSSPATKNVLGLTVWVSPLHLSLQQSQQIVTFSACCHSQGTASAPVSGTQEETLAGSGQIVCDQLVLKSHCHMSSVVKGGCVTMVHWQRVYEVSIQFAKGMATTLTECM